MTTTGEPLVIGEWDDAKLTDRLLEPVVRPSRWLSPLLLVSLGGALVMFTAIGYTFLVGIGAWGNNVPVGWAFAIIDFVWWIGIGHAGTFISAILLLLQQGWRTSLNRIAEGMTLFALVQAALMPIIHLGRPWFFYWLVPYPATMGVWPQFMSALTWDVAAVSTYTIVSILFWYVGLIPDLATARDRATSLGARRAYGIFALGWRGTAVQWRHYRVAELLLAGLATPLVLSVHSIVSMDFAMAKLPGWHSAIFPPYFVAGAILSGFAMVTTLVVPLRRLYRLYDVITARHLDLIAKMLLVMGMLVSYSYAVELVTAWYSGETYERYVLLQNRPLGPYAWLFWLMIGCNVLAPQLLWFPNIRKSPVLLWMVALAIQVGMWTERFVLIVTSEHRDFLPSSWANYRPSVVDGAILFGSICFFVFLFTMMVRYVPFVPIAQAKEALHEHSRRSKPVEGST